MAPAKRSAGRLRVRCRGAPHHSKTPITPTLLNASSQKGAAIPNPAIITPANAGPNARLMLMPTLLAATAGDKSSLGTRSGTIDCQAGASHAEKVLVRNINSSNRAGVTTSIDTSIANAAETKEIRISRIKIKRRLSIISARAPAGSANRNIGRVVATWTRATINGSPVRVVISQPADALYIHPPMFATTVAIHRARKTECRKGLHAEDAANGTFSRPVPFSSLV